MQQKRQRLQVCTRVLVVVAAAVKESGSHYVVQQGSYDSVKRWCPGGSSLYCGSRAAVRRAAINTASGCLIAAAAAKRGA
ncbi:hypothetical protein NDU88_005212 [Pleurodeles waltl]|uniref:Secreted protein n=1 Tax=Pleurodeles waltl TaxID=8319 RepID=A0AAV7QE20_PLEWA|nr:hypothetical protein NDU88_005212 [Pleurodeles waltl]